MNKLHKLLFLISIIVVGCKTNDIDEKIINQTINSLNMNILSKDGKKLLKVVSPYSKYNKDKNSFILKETTINLFKDNEIEYIISSDESRLSNNNKLLELNGNVLVNNVKQKADKLYANSFIWNIQNSEYLLDGNVKFENDSISLSSNKAILYKTNNTIEFFNPVKYKINDINNESGYEINSENAYYNIETNSVSFTSSEERVRSKIFF
tara:strand:+ start:786 stop:1412 length:627 start_codon:yes stop_codon:yes gene_type:complete